jgi:small-conductance mechanosensitive channel
VIWESDIPFRPYCVSHLMLTSSSSAGVAETEEPALKVEPALEEEPSEEEPAPEKQLSKRDKLKQQRRRQNERRKQKRQRDKEMKKQQAEQGHQQIECVSACATNCSRFSSW